jgi:hypothetical protein
MMMPPVDRPAASFAELIADYTELVAWVIEDDGIGEMALLLRFAAMSGTQVTHVLGCLAALRVFPAVWKMTNYSQTMTSEEFESCFPSLAAWVPFLPAWPFDPSEDETVQCMVRGNLSLLQDCVVGAISEEEFATPMPSLILETDQCWPSLSLLRSIEQARVGLTQKQRESIEALFEKQTIDPSDAEFLLNLPEAAFAFPDLRARQVWKERRSLAHSLAKGPETERVTAVV